MHVRYSIKHTTNHRKFLTFLVILVLLVSQLPILQFVPNVYASTVEEVYTNSFDARVVDWFEFGSSPYLHDSTSDYIYIGTDLKEEGDWHFPNSTGSGTINSVKIRFELKETVADAGAMDVYVWNGASWVFADELTCGTTYLWYEIDVSSILNTWAKINGTEVYVHYVKVATNTWYTRRLTRKVTYTLPDTAKPTYSNVGTNTTSAGQPCNFSVTLADETALANYTFGTNNTGSWVNGSAVTISGISYKANTTKTLNSTVGIVVQWEYWFADSSNNKNNTGIQSLTTTSGKAWHAVSTWTASLVIKTWSSGMSFNFNLQTRIWSSTYPSLYEYYNTGDNYNSGVYGIYWLAQTFTVGAESHTVTSVKLKMFRIGNPETVTVSIRATNSSGNPTGDDLTSGTIDGNSFTEDTAGLWYEITLTEYSLNASTKYAIVARAPDGNSTNIADWRFKLYSNYSGGCYEYSANSGVTWASSPVEDLMFEVWGRRPIVNWLFDFGTRIWVDAATWTYDWVTMAWENITWIFYLGTSIWKDIAAWVFYPLTRLWNGIAVWAYDVTAMMWRDLTWLFYLLPPLPEWVNVAVWIFSLRSSEWMLVALLNFQLGAGGIAFLFIAILLLIVIVAGIIAIAYRRPKQ